MSERSRDEKLAAAKKKLKKFQENNIKIKNKEEVTFDITKDTKVPQCSNLNLKTVPYDKHCFELSKDDSPEQSNSVDLILNEKEPTATTESLKQISRHLNGIISRSSSSIDGELQQDSLSAIRELEKRNVELASFNSQKAEQIECLNAKISNMNDSIEKITKDNNIEKYNLENSYKRQIESYRSQLQAQIHTISLLVAEKSELQSQVTHNQKLANQRYQENEDLINKLKASRQRVGDLEKLLNEIKITSDKADEAKREISRQLDQTRTELKKLKLEKDDFLTESSQLRSKLVAKTQEVSNLELTLDDIKTELEMSQVQIQHLTNNQEGHYDNLCGQLKAIEKRNCELIKELEMSKLQLQQAESQNNRLQVQYRNYFEQMEERLKSAQTEIFTVTEDKGKLFLQLDHLKKEIALCKESESATHDKTVSDLENKNSVLMKNLEVLKTSNLDLNEKLNTLTVFNAELVERNTDQADKIRQYESNQIDYAQLLNQLQSDKSTLSRALAQNKQLKVQLVELQEAFVKLSSDNMDFSTQLQHEKHVSKELASRLGEQEDELNEIRQMVNKKDEEISKLNHINQQVTEELLTANNTENSSLPRSESHFNMANKVVMENLQTDLLNLQERINQLTTENNNLTQQLHHFSNTSVNLTENKELYNEIQNLTLHLRQTEAERDELLAKFEVHRLKEEHLADKFDTNGSENSEEEYLLLKEINKQMKVKVQEVESRNIILVEENQRLEHLVEQLEGETDTIAEYINLYQHQRSILKQKCKARDQLMSKLMHQKELINNRIIILENMLKSVPPPTEDIEEDTNKEKENKLSIYENIFNIIRELQISNDVIFQPSDKSGTNNNDGGKYECNFDNGLVSDDLFHYQIIHCKCCVGNIIDL